MKKRKFGGWTIEEVPGTRVVGCSQCLFNSKPHRYWWQGRLEVWRHKRRVHR